MVQMTIDQAMRIAIGHHQGGPPSRGRGDLSPDPDPGSPITPSCAAPAGPPWPARWAGATWRPNSIAPSDRHQPRRWPTITVTWARFTGGRVAGRGQSPASAAIELRPDHGIAHANLGIALRAAGRLDEAIAAYRHAIALRPESAEAHANLGAALMEAGQAGEAIVACRRGHRAVARPGRGARQPGALPLWPRAGPTRRSPRTGTPFCCGPNLPRRTPTWALHLMEAGQTGEAIVAYRRAIAPRPELARAHANLALALMAPRAGPTRPSPPTAVPSHSRRIVPGPTPTWARPCWRTGGSTILKRNNQPCSTLPPSRRPESRAWRVVRSRRVAHNA